MSKEQRIKIEFIVAPIQVFTGIWYDRRRREAFRITSTRREILTNTVIIDMESANGKRQQFSGDFMFTLIERGELMRPHLPIKQTIGQSAARGIYAN